MRTFLFPVDSSHVLQFSRAIGDASPVLDDPRFAEIALSGAVVPPPTFLVAADHFDPECPRRPIPGEAFPGSGRVDKDWTPPPRPSRPGRGLHAEEVFEFARHPRVGELLTVNLRDGDEWEKPGRNGTLNFRETVSEFIDADGDLVATTRWRSVSTVSMPGSPAPSGPPPTERPGPAVAAPAPAAATVATVAPAHSLPTQPLRAGQLAVGDRWSGVVVDRLTIGQLVRYAGASGDFIALHHDRDIADQVGTYGGVFAHGMLTMGASSRAISAVVGTARLRRLSSRMLKIVRPGDTLTTEVWVESVGAPSAEGSVVIALQMRTTTQNGSVALDGTAEALLEA